MQQETESDGADGVTLFVRLSVQPSTLILRTPTPEMRNEEWKQGSTIKRPTRQEPVISYKYAARKPHKTANIGC